MVKESENCSPVIKEYFNKELVMTKEDDENLKALQNIRFVIILLLMAMLRDHCHITRKYREAPHRGCYINVILNYKISIKFHSLKNHDYILLCMNLEKPVL